MRTKVAWFAVVVLVAGSMAMAANVQNSELSSKVHQLQTQGSRDNGTLTNLSVTLDQTGPLQAEVVVTATTTGFVAPATGLEGVLLYGQIYDYPWQPPYGTDNDFISGLTSTIRNTGQGTFQLTASFTVPAADTYQSWGLAYVGYYPGYPGGPTTGFWYAQRGTTAGPTLYIDAVVPPTSTPDPSAGGTPIPTMNRWGILAMIVILAGVAMLLVTRRS